ncbi:MAG: hypothetical protein WD334_09640 [Chitinophagales bacterium]
MDYFFLTLIFLSFIGLVVGLIKPDIALFWVNTKKTRAKAFFIYFGILLVLLMIFGIIPTNKAKSDYGYKIEKTDSTSQQITLRILLPNRFSKDTLIDIARIEKEKRKWTSKFVCFFYNQGDNIESTAWASISYLPKCNNCSTDKDKSKNDVVFSLIGLDAKEYNEAEVSLDKLSYEISPNEVLVAEFIDELNKAKCQFIEIDNSSAIKVLLWTNGDISKEYYDIKTVNGQRRYYFSSKNEYYEDDVEQFWIFDKSVGTMKLTGMSDYTVKLLK